MIGYKALKGRSIYSILFGELSVFRIVDIICNKTGEDALIAEAYGNQWTITDFSSGLGKIYFLSMSSALKALRVF
ncbi:MAG: hypothetical protein IJY55_00410 [Clostridia bacterium]|nr:hypothetical protein [Clostridia bacterium]